MILPALKKEMLSDVEKMLDAHRDKINAGHPKKEDLAKLTDTIGETFKKEIEGYVKHLDTKLFAQEQRMDTLEKRLMNTEQNLFDLIKK